jgi:hypothetical protein
MRMPHIARWILMLEMIVCFFPITFMFAALVARGAFGFAGPLELNAWYASTLFGTLIGPLGFVVAFQVIALRRARVNLLLLALMAASGAWVLGWYISSAPAHWSELWSGAWRSVVLLALLPLAGTGHLVALAAQNRNPHIEA